MNNQENQMQTEQLTTIIANLFKDEFVAEITATDTSVALRFLSGQTFEVIVKERN